MQTASTNICKRIGHSQELSEFKRGTVIVCHFCNRSISEISLLLNIPRSIVSGIITKWKQLGTATKPRSGRPHEMTERGQHMHVAFRLAQQQCIESFMEWVAMTEQLHPSLTSPSTMQSVGCMEMCFLE
ncbi:unnamed protein product [Staurois parvus]|uniref:Transposase n=1 Tax=Staurois parvus TaxID=386267 RepID=A0ABN9FUX1_9NEOB|nr:unnamed protein product [Staurois parvus]